ncbi:MAG: MATE family efflux transporter, partial [Oricola sp.]
MESPSPPVSRPFEVTNRMVFAIAAPMTLAFLTTPLLGIVDTTVIGQFGDAALIGGLAVGAIIFDIVFTTFNFLRSGTTGFVAQAVGREDEAEQQAVFWRAIILAAGLGVALLALSWPIRELGILLMNPGPGVTDATRTYVAIRMLAAPFSLINYAILGLLLGQGRAVTSLVLQTLLNGINIIGSVYFGLVLGWAIEGVALGTILGEATAAAAGFWWIMRGFHPDRRPTWAHILERKEFLRLVSVNRDIMIRSFALLAGFSLFTRTGAQFGAVTLAANAILMNFFMIAGYYLDGFATAA